MAKRIIAALLAGIMVLNLCACGGGAEDEEVKLNVPEGTPTYADDKQVEIGAYSGPRVGGYRQKAGVVHLYEGDPESGWDGWITEETFQDYMDCGFTYLMANSDGLYDYNTVDATSVTEFEDSDAYAYMELAQKMNIPVVVSSNFLKNLTGSTDSRLSDDAKEKLKEMVEDFSQYSVFKGFTFRDEPEASMIKSSGVVKEYLDSLKPDLYYYTSCLPIYVSDVAKLSTENHDNKEQAYRDYVSAYSDAMGTFSYDSYPLKIDPVSGTTTLIPTWFQNLRLVAEDAKEKGYAPGVTVQSTGFGTIGGEFTSVHNREITHKRDATFQMYSAMAYGFKHFSWFTYWEFRNKQMVNEEFYGAMVNYPADGTNNAVKTDAYYAVQEANLEIKKFDHVYMNFDWEGTMALTTEGKKLSSALSMAGDYNSPRIKEATATNDTLIGCLKDADGYDGFMIVNATEPGQDMSDSVTVTFREASKALAYIQGEEQTIELENGTYTFELASGEGVFVIPIK